MRRQCLIIWLGACALLTASSGTPASAALVPIGFTVPPGLTTNAGVGTGFTRLCGNDAGKGGLVLGAPEELVSIGFTETLADCGMTGNQQILNGPGPAPVVANATYAINPGPFSESFSGVAGATATMGVLGASARDSFTCPFARCGPGTGFSDGAFGMATFTDTLIVIPGETLIGFCPLPGGSCAPPGDGDPGGLVLTVDVAGSASGILTTGGNAAGNGELEVGVQFIENIGGTLKDFGTNVGDCGFASSSTVITCPNELPFIYGVPFNLTVGYGAATSGGISGSTSPVADFLDTATLSGIQVFDERPGFTGVEWGGWSITSASGTVYGPNGVSGSGGVSGGSTSVPEPSPWLLLSTGFAALIAEMGRRRLRPKSRID
jgi:hypothetical protein